MEGKTDVRQSSRIFSIRNRKIGTLNWRAKRGKKSPIKKLKKSCLKFAAL